MTDELISVDLSESEETALLHVGVLHKSGRYPWGSGENPAQRGKMFLDYVQDLKRKGMTDAQIAKGLSDDASGHRVTSSDIRAATTIATSQKRAADVARAEHLKYERQMSNVAAAKEMGINESSFRALLDPGKKERTNSLENMANLLRDSVAEKRFVDVGEGVENHLGISNQQLKVAVSMLKEEGYEQHIVRVPQQGTGKETTLKVLAAPGVTWNEVRLNKADIRPPRGYTEDNGRTIKKDPNPISISSKRIMIKHGDEGGDEKDGVLEIRRNVDDVSLGGKLYAQVRVKVDDTHYLKGMAMYADDLPDGVDIRFNTNKTRAAVEAKGQGKLGALKEIDPKTGTAEAPFGAITRPRMYIGKDGKEHQSYLNIVNEEGDWDKWGKSLSSQVLSKQSPTLAKTQLDLRLKEKRDEYDEIMRLTNPTVRKKLLQSFAEDADSSAVHLKAAALPRQRTQVILPIKSMKDTEVYAPNFRDGEQVVLIRYPHGGIFEIPELTVNNRHAESKRLIGGARDGIGISSKVAARLSGADFDGDTVLVIPNNGKQIKNHPKLKELEGFDPQSAYPKYPGMKVMSGRTKQLKMGDVSNLITDMTIKGAPFSEIALAVKHSMVVIDAEKHKLNWQQSAKDNHISELKRKYQGDARAGAQTVISRASSQKKVFERKLRSAKDGGPIDPNTGKLVWEYSGAEYTKPGKTVVSKKGVVKDIPPKTVRKMGPKSSQMAETDDAYSLLSKDPTPLEYVYANHANSLKALANDARKSWYSTPNLVKSPTARKVYSGEVASLNAKLKTAYMNKPLERQAQLLAGTIEKAAKDANPDMDPAELKKWKGRALNQARERVGAKKARVEITSREWEAIQAGAISNNLLKNILDNADEDMVKAYAMPRQGTVMTDTKTARAQAMLNSGYDRSAIADALGVSVSTLNSSIAAKEGGS